MTMTVYIWGQSNSTQWIFRTQNVPLQDSTITNAESITKKDNKISLVTGEDCNIFLRNKPFKASDYSTVEVKMSLSRDGVVQMFFSKGNIPYSEPASCAKNIHANSTVKSVKLNFANNKLWNGTISTLRLDPTNTPQVKVEINSVKLLSPAYDSWQLINASNILSANDSLNFCSGKDINFVNPECTFDASKFPVLEITMSSSRDDTGTVFFGSAKIPRNKYPFSGQASVNFPVKASTMQTYRVDCSSNPLWKGKMRTLRIDPVGDKEGANVKIQSIRLLPSK